MEERKKRIMRKYITQDAALSESDFLIPSQEMEDERVLDSEIFKGKENLLNQQTTSAAMPMPRPPPRRPAPQKQNSNWLLDNASETDDDPYAMGSELGDSWSTWGDPKTTAKKTKKKRKYTPPKSSSSSRWGNDRSFSSDRYGSEQSSGFGRSSTQTDLFGRSRTSSYPPPLNASQTQKTYGSSPSTGLLNPRFSQQNKKISSPRASGSDPKSNRGYTPYKNFNQSMKERNQNQQGTQRPAQEFKRVDPYQKWRKKSPSWDPTAEDAYINEFMKPNRH